MAKKPVVAKKRVVKVDANGQLHVHSSFNNIIVTIANSEGQSFPGLQQEKWDSVAQRKIRLMQHRWLRRIVQKSPTIWG